MLEERADVWRAPRGVATERTLREAADAGAASVDLVAHSSFDASVLGAPALGRCVLLDPVAPPRACADGPGGRPRFERGVTPTAARALVLRASWARARAGRPCRPASSSCCGATASAT